MGRLQGAERNTRREKLPAETAAETRNSARVLSPRVNEPLPGPVRLPLRGTGGEDLVLGSSCPRNRSGLRETGKRPRRRRVVPRALSGEPEGAVGHRGLSVRRVLWCIVYMAHTVLDPCLRNESFVTV